MKTNPQIDALERQLKSLRIEFEKFFNGALDLPPSELQYKVDRGIRALRGSVKGSIDQFRLSGIEAQFNSYNEMFNRRVRDIEEGRARLRQSGDARPRYDPSTGVLVGETLDDGAVAALYQGLYTDSAASKKVDLDNFRSYLNRQASMIRDKTGCREVQFRLASEGGKMKLKAKPIRPPKND